jgi:hypothetical protein
MESTPEKINRQTIKLLEVKNTNASPVVNKKTIE